jgi:hypothetical protein
MSRFRLVVLGLMSAFVLMGVASSSASAVEFKLEATACTGGTSVAFCWAESETGELKELVGEEEFSALLDNGASTLNGSLSGLGVAVSCTEAENVLSVSRLVQSSPLPTTDYKAEKVELLFLGCSVTGPNCTVKEPIEVTKSEGTPENLSLVLSETWLRFKPEAAKAGIFTEIKFEGASCPETIAGLQPVKGEQWCEWQEILLDLKEHLLVCSPTESSLVLGKNEATFSASFELAPDNAGTDLFDIEETA